MQVASRYLPRILLFYISVLKGCFENIVWFNVKNLFFNELVLFGAVYTS